MKLSDARENYYFYTGKVSEIGRQLAFAGIAIIWLFKLEDENSLPLELIEPLRLIVASLAIDLAHYFYAALAWGVFHRVKEKRLAASKMLDAEFLAPRAINWITIALYFAKIGFLAAGYWHLFGYLTGKLI